MKCVNTNAFSATPMTKSEYHEKRNWELPADENGDDEGYLIMHLNGSKPNCSMYPNFVHWSPKDFFEVSYRKSGELPFGAAIELLKRGCKVARKGWNGKGLSVELQAPDENSKMTLPYIFMNYPPTPASDTAPVNHINARVPWLASQTDMLAEDWMEVAE